MSPFALKSPAWWGLRLKQFLLCWSIWLLAGQPARALIGTAYQLQLGNPSGATANPANHQHFLLERSVAACDYNDQLGLPNWVSWDLTAPDIGDSGRTSSFYIDPDLPSTFYKVSEGDYSNSGFTRGHMCPSMDRTDSVEHNKLVFYMSNIIPQTADNNGGVWSGLEIYSQTLAKAGNELLLICGPGGFDGSRIQPSGKVAIPAYTWKIVVVVPPGEGFAVDRITASNRVIAVKIPNINGIAGIPWTSYVTSVNQLQTDTGLVFFSALPPQVATVLRGLVDGTPAPIVSGFWPPLGTNGTPIVITGTNLASTTSVTIAGTEAPFTVDSNIRITALAPALTHTGPVTVVTPGGLATSAASFGVANSGQVSILSQPVGSTVSPGSPVVLTVQAMGAPPLVYQWWRDALPLTNGGQLSGATNDSLSIAAAGSDDAGSYYVIVTNDSGSVTSSVAILTLTTDTRPPGILSQPASLSLLPGQNATFQVTATGSSLAYNWRFNGQVLSGATQSSFTRFQVGAGDAGAYSVVLTNSYGAITSTEARLTLVSAGQPTVIAQWNFNQTNASVTSPLPSSGTGAAALMGGTTATYATGTAADTGANGVNNAWNSTTYAAQGAGNKSRGVQFNVSTRGYRNLVVAWEQRLSNTASKYYRLQYTTNGVDFLDGPLVTMAAAGSFESKTNSLIGVAGVEDNPRFAFRVVAEFESTAMLTGNANYASASTSAYGSGGTTRYDLITLSGSPLPVTCSLTMTQHGPDWFEVSATGTPDSRHVLEGSTDLAAWTPILTNSLPFLFIETNLDIGNSRFYRTTQVP